MQIFTLLLSLSMDDFFLILGVELTASNAIFSVIFLSNH